MTQDLESRSATRTVRAYRSGDRSDFLSLYNTVFGHDRSAEWFHWKYETNPFVDHVPIVVATANDRVVGCRSFFALEMSVDGEHRLALQPCDTMVHSDHRRRGLFDRMNELALERYVDGDPSFCFNFPNEQSKPGNEKYGWRPLGTVAMHYRPQNPVTVAIALSAADRSRQDGETQLTAAERALAEAITTAHRTCDRVLTRSRPDVRVCRHETPPYAALESIYRRSIPDGIHTARTERFYRWRLANPVHRYVTYTATQNGEPVAALIVSPDDDHVRIVDSLPRGGGGGAYRRALETILVRVLSDYADRGYVTAFGTVLPRPTSYRFLTDTQFPFSSVLRPTARTLYARDLDSDLSIEDGSIRDWTLSRLDLDTA